VDGAIEAINPKVLQNPSLFMMILMGRAGCFMVKPVNLRRNLENLLSGEGAVIWINEESHRLLKMMDTRVGVTLPDGGAIADDVYGNYQDLGWRPLVKHSSCET